jgi:hypothetical protein
MAEFGARMQALYGAEFGRLDIREWIARAAEGGMDPFVSSSFESLVEKGRVVGFPYLAQALELVVREACEQQRVLSRPNDPSTRDSSCTASAE